MTQIEIGYEGTAKIAGLGFSYQLSKLNKKNIAPKNHTYLRIVIPYRSMMFAGTSLVKYELLHDPESFMLVCRELIKKILEANEIFVEALYAENS